MSNSPPLTVVIATPDNFATIRRTVGYLRAQTVQAHLELLILARSQSTIRAEPGELDGFRRVKVLELGELRNAGTVKSAGVRGASAPVIAFAEDHCYPDATWAEALVEAHQQSCAAVGPELINANPNTQIGRADFMLNFGKWAEPIESGSVDGCAWHNTSYKRDILLDYGDDLPRMLDVEGVLHQDLRAKGMGLFQESAAKAYHLNFALFRSYAYAHWVSGRQYGGGRSTDWSLFKRLLYAAGSPLIPLMRLRDVSGHLRRCSSEQRRMLGMLWALSAGILIASAAEALSYVAGPGDSSEQKFLMEFHRERHVPTSDLRALRTPDAPRPMERTN